jgi:hypothetical protein
MQDSEIERALESFLESLGFWTISIVRNSNCQKKSNVSVTESVSVFSSEDRPNRVGVSLPQLPLPEPFRF